MCLKYFLYNELLNILNEQDSVLGLKFSDHIFDKQKKKKRYFKRKYNELSTPVCFEITIYKYRYTIL